MLWIFFPDHWQAAADIVFRCPFASIRLTDSVSTSSTAAAARGGGEGNADRAVMTRLGSSKASLSMVPAVPR